MAEPSTSGVLLPRHSIRGSAAEARGRTAAIPSYALRLWRRQIRPTTRSAPCRDHSRTSHLRGGVCVLRAYAEGRCSTGNRGLSIIVEASLGHRLHGYETDVNA